MPNHLSKRRAVAGQLGSMLDSRMVTSRPELALLKPDSERLVAHLEQRTPWDS